MQLISFSVSNFRSITTAKKIPVSQYSVLVGPNNEGKSNILHALAIGMEILESYRYSVRRDRLGRIISVPPSLLGRRSRYNWTQDYPISKQRRGNTTGCTEIVLEFQLSDNEIDDFQREIGSRLNGTLPITIRCYRDNFDVSIAKQGRGGAVLTRKANRVADFVSRRVKFEYIPAIRTSSNAEEVINDFVSRELARLDQNQDYNAAIAKILELQQPVLDTLSESIRATVAAFLPSVKSVHFSSSRDTRFHALLRRSFRIEIDDGNKTTLDRKGDGVKSLVALALMRHASTQANSADASIVAIEEPEAHLHPQAIHELRDVITSLSEKHQIVLTTHSPLFVNPSKLSSTIIVQGSKARLADDISEVRNVLGVRLSDNLQSARLVAIVEGDDDEIILRSLISQRFPELDAALASGDVVFDAMGGASNLSYKVRTYRSSASMVQCLLDNDVAGTEAVRRAASEGVITVADYNLISTHGLRESEIEDLFDPRKYKDDFLQKFGVDPTTQIHSKNKKKWSDAMRERFQSSGKLWDKNLEQHIKLWLANYVSAHPEGILYEARFEPVRVFAEAILRKLRS